MNVICIRSLDDPKYIKRLVKEINKKIKNGSAYFGETRIYRASTVPSDYDSNSLIPDSSQLSGYRIKIGLWLKIEPNHNNWMQVFATYSGTYNVHDGAGKEIVASRII